MLRDPFQEKNYPRNAFARAAAASIRKPRSLPARTILMPMPTYFCMVDWA